MTQSTSFSLIYMNYTHTGIHACRWTNILRSSTKDREGVEDPSSQLGAPEKAREGRAGVTRT